MSTGIDSARTTMDMVKTWGQNIMLQDNVEGVDKNPATGSMDFELKNDGYQAQGTLQYDTLPGQMKQLRAMALTLPEGSINYGRIPDSTTEMASIVSKADNTEISVVVDEQKGIYEYHQRTPGSTTEK